PNLHELVRPGGARIENPEVAPTATPEETAAVNEKLKQQAIIASAMAKLDALPRPAGQAGGLRFVEHGMAHQPPAASGDYASPFTKGTKGEVTPSKLAGAAKQKPNDVPLISITLVSPDAPDWHIKDAIHAKTQPVAILVKKGGALYPAS